MNCNKIEATLYLNKSDLNPIYFSTLLQREDGYIVSLRRSLEKLQTDINVTLTNVISQCDELKEKTVVDTEYNSDSEDNSED